MARQPLPRHGNMLRSWVERAHGQAAHENSNEMDEGEAEAKANMQQCWAKQAISVHYMVHKT
ncbi:hypothetical protein CASFOL_012611 [Castilleja foliolosa]|uniref:Uncharacterized protein n=1 Tax=Castilleja foliolosa TaxID=1961234 RepID=A0ABD3DHK0_9LAMI